MDRRNLTGRLLGLCVFALAFLVACASSNPIDVSNPIEVAHSTKIFSLTMPASWQHIQDKTLTESVMVFTDPTQKAELIGYAGLLDRRLTDAEGFQIASDLINSLLKRPADFVVTDQQRRSDGTFAVKFSYSRDQQKRLGEAILSDKDLALSAVIADGVDSTWPQVRDALQPFVTSFKVDPVYVQGTYFVPVENVGFAFAGPADWQKQSGTRGTIMRSRNGNMAILAVQQPLTTTLDTPALAQATVGIARTMGSPGNLVSSQQLPDGRTKLVYERPQHRVIGYVDQKDQMLAGLLFDVPLDQAEAYQPFIDFVYSTFVTGKP